jgi:hypothetical protein
VWWEYLSELPGDLLCTKPGSIMTCFTPVPMVLSSRFVRVSDSSQRNGIVFLSACHAWFIARVVTSRKEHSQSAWDLTEFQKKLHPVDFVVFSTAGSCGCSMPSHNFHRVRFQ